MKRYALLGEKLGHSFSPQIHKIILKAMKLVGEYELVEIPMGELNDQYPNIIKQYEGLNVTIPYKKDILSVLQGQDKVSKEIGAVNTIKIHNGKSKGYNTDYYGFGRMLDYYDVKITDKRIVIIGTGGVSKAVYYYLKYHNVREIIFVNRTKSTHWATDCPIFTYDEINHLTGDLIINCTPLGMGELKGKSPVEKSTLSNFKVAVDLIYNPKNTVFLQWAQEKGLQTINGLFMLVAQAAKAQEIWNDIKIEDNIMEKIYIQVKAIY